MAGTRPIGVKIANKRQGRPTVSWPGFTPPSPTFGADRGKVFGSRHKAGHDDRGNGPLPFSAIAVPAPLAGQLRVETRKQIRPLPYPGSHHAPLQNIPTAHAYD